MKSEIKKLWVEALRSGEYQQCKGVLHDSNGYCCLGVLTELYRKTTGDGEWVNSKDNIAPFFLFKNLTPTGRFDKIHLPFCIQKWAGLDYPNPEVKIRGRYTTLASENDSGVDFEKIATIIEEQL